MKTNDRNHFDEICHKWSDEHVVESIVFIVEDVFQTSSAAERCQDANVTWLDASAEEWNQIVVT
jgi:hypothetical protein